MEIQWTADYNMTGNGYGYTMHQRNMRAALEGIGCSMTDRAGLAVHITTPPSFKPVEGKFNVLFTMYEMARLPKEWPGYLQGADLLVVPCEHNRRLFAQYTDLPIEVVWEGVHPDQFELRKRERPGAGQKFRYLWIGASNPRKGYEHVAIAWQKFYTAHPELHGRVELYLKTTQPMTESRNLHLVEAGAIFDNRDMPIEELIALYESAHVFLFPTMGEGWGLTLHEAMATGLPAIYTPWSAPASWVPKKYAYPLKFGMKTIKAMKQREDGTSYVYHQAPAANPDTDHLARRMYQLYSRYEEAAEAGFQAGKIVREITWDRAAREFADKVFPHYRRAHGSGLVA